MSEYTLCSTAGKKEHGDLIESFLDDHPAQSKRETVEGADADFPTLKIKYDTGAEESVTTTVAIMKSIGKSFGCYSTNQDQKDPILELYCELLDKLQNAGQGEDQIEEFKTKALEFHKLCEQKLAEGANLKEDRETVADVCVRHYASAHVTKASSPVHAAIQNTLLDETPKFKALIDSL